MALLTDKQTEKDLSERLEEFSQFGMILNYMLDIEEVSVTDLDKMFFATDRDKASIIYSKLLKQMKPSYIESAYTIYSHEYPNNKDFDDISYNAYLNKCCVNDIISKISSNKKTDKTYVNTYNYLLENKDTGYIRK